MATGACGINCDVCGLRILGYCSSCDSGRGEKTPSKISAQIRFFGAPCPILACASANNVEYCMRDCPRFPCNHFKSVPYPFSRGFLEMQERRRREYPILRAPSGAEIEVPQEYWDRLKSADMETLCKEGGVSYLKDDKIGIDFMNQSLVLDIRNRFIEDTKGVKVKNPLLEICILLYLLNSYKIILKNRMIGIKELKDSHFFRGPHDLRTDALIERYGDNIESFKRSAESLGAEFLDMGDLSFKLNIFPKLPIIFVFWKGDEEFSPSITLLFDSSIEECFSADAIWGMANLAIDSLLRAGMVSPHLPKDLP